MNRHQKRKQKALQDKKHKHAVKYLKKLWIYEIELTRKDDKSKDKKKSAFHLKFKKEQSKEDILKYVSKNITEKDTKVIDGKEVVKQVPINLMNYEIVIKIINKGKQNEN